jgi:DNA mismatch repair ATPase MutS
MGLCGRPLLARSSKHIVTFFATHFHELTKLQDVTHGKFKNYRLDAQQYTRGGYACLYRLQEGVSLVNIASDVMRQKLDGFDIGDVEGDLHNLLAIQE